MRMPFGKHKNVDISDLPDDYLAWLAGNATLFGRLRQAVRDELEDRGMPTGDLDDNPEQDRQYAGGGGNAGNFNGGGNYSGNYGAGSNAGQSASGAWNFGGGGARQLSIADADRAILLDLVNTGFKNLAMRYHPDQGGDAEKMRRLNLLVASLRGQLNGGGGKA
jgi:uncharacterized protein (DUF3820 family)